MILHPWGHTETLPENVDALRTVAVAMADAIDAHRLPYFAKYQVGNSVDLIGYETSGAAEDYAYSIGVPLAYTIELPGLDSGNESFNLNPRYIEQVCRETWEGIVVGARRAGDYFVERKDV